MRHSDQVAFVDAYRFPSAVRQRFAFTHESLRADQIDQVEAATRQWFRLVAQHPRAHLSMPSTAVDDLTREFAMHTGEYATFCDSAFGKLLHHEAGNDALRHTFQLAQKDERPVPPALPLIFRVDRDLRVPNGRYYLATCGGGRTACHGLPGAVCLQHLRGAPHSKTPYDTRPEFHEKGPSGMSGWVG
jgi:hypothetical protein